MAIVGPLINAWVRVNGVDLSDHTSEVSVTMTAADIDITTMGAGGHQRMAGLRDDKFALTMFSDMSAGKVDATLAPLLPNVSIPGGSLFLVEVAANGTAISATNPKYSGTCILLEYDPIAGKVGDAAMTPVTLPVNGYITRATV